MNKLSLERRAAVVRGLIDGASIRAVARMTNTDKDTVSRILVEVGEFCSIYQDHALRHLPCVRIEADEIWSFVGAKEANKTCPGQGDIWSFTAMCADSKLMVTWLVGPRGGDSAQRLMADLAARLTKRIQLSTDAFKAYPAAVEREFGWNRCDYATITKKYQSPPSVLGPGRYSPSPVVTSVEVIEVMGRPDPRKVSTSYVERANLSMRMNMRRFTRLTNAFSKKAENHAHAVSLHFMAHNYLRAHGTLTKAAKGYKTSPAMVCGLTDHVWSVEEMLSKMEPSYLIAA
ncbi:MAG: IS1 family transposase [Gemmatimonadota bacterium]